MRQQCVWQFTNTATVSQIRAGFQEGQAKCAPPKASSTSSDCKQPSKADKDGISI